MYIPREYKLVAMPSSLPIDVEFNQGIHVLDSVLWLDAPRKTDLCFLSHAHIDPVGAQEKILATPATAALMRRRTGPGDLTTPYFRRFSLGETDLELHPAGHMLGSAQIRITRDGRTLVYTGDFQLEPTRTAGTASVLECDVLVLRATYGLPRHVFPNRQEVEVELVSWAQRALLAGEQPVVFASPLGKAPELASILLAHGLRVRVHKSIYRVCRTYRAMGVQLPGIRCFRLSPGKEEVIIFPPNLRRSRAIARMRSVRTGVVTGQALNGTDAAFAISGHADHPALLRYVRESGAKKIHLTGPAAAPLASELSAAGHDASPLQPSEQMALF
jgi:putative mRNA 3-end processing factor